MCWHRKVDRKSVGEGKRVDISVTGVQTCALPISVMVHRYPAAVKAFYMATDAARPDLALCVDVLAPEGYGEVIGGGERSADLDYLLKQIHAHGLPEEAFDWYLDLRKYGTFPHGGFGMGIERCVAWLCGLEHVRETIPF